MLNPLHGGRLRLLIAVVTMVLVACGGADTDTGSVVTSTDGLATLSVAVEDLPAGVDLNDVSLEAAVIESEDPAMPMLAVQLLPDGLVLEQPVALTVTLPRPPSDGLVVVHTSGDSMEFLGGEFEVADDELTFTTEVEHFSLVTYVDYEMAGFAPTPALAPQQVLEGQSQTAVAKVNLPRVPFQFWGHFSSDAPDDWRLVGFSAPLPPVRLRVPVYVWGSSWNPTAQRVGATPTPTGWDIGRALSDCVSPNITSVRLSAEAVFDVELLGVSAPIAPVLRIFATMPTGIDPTPIDTRVGEMMHLTVNVYANAPTSCVGQTGATATSPTSTSTTQPGSDESDDLIGVGGEGEVRDTSWYYAQGLDAAIANLESITDCEVLDPLWEAFSGMVGVDQDDAAAVELALALDEVAYELRQRLGC